MRAGITVRWGEVLRGSHQDHQNQVEKNCKDVMNKKDMDYRGGRGMCAHTPSPILLMRKY